jgi:hypothetical protein
MTGGATETTGLDGVWKLSFPCAGATGVYPERCAAGVRDYFVLELWSEGSCPCDFHLATAHLGNRLDEADRPAPSIVGTFSGTKANVAFESARAGLAMPR